MGARPLHVGNAGRRTVAIIGAPSSIGIRPYDDGGGARRLDLAPAVLRELGLAERLAAEDLGDVIPPPYRDFARTPGQVRNELEVADYSRSLGERVALGIEDGRFAVVLGGDCSIVLGSLLGAGRRAGRIGLVYIDAHADFATPEESYTGSAASMCLAMAVGRGDSPLARLSGATPPVRAEDTVLIGRRDVGQPGCGSDVLRAFGVLDIPHAAVQEGGTAAAVSTALERVERTDIDGIWIHVDADVLDPRVMPAVDSPEPGGPGIEDLAALARPLVKHGRALGMQVTIYDPALDRERKCAERIVGFLESVLAEIPE